MRATPQPDSVWFTAQGQVVIPGRLRREFHIEKGTRNVVVSTPEGILLKPVTKHAIARRPRRRLRFRAGQGTQSRTPHRRTGVQGASEGNQDCLAEVGAGDEHCDLRLELGLRPGQTPFWKRVSDTEVRIQVPKQGQKASVRGAMKKILSDRPKTTADWIKLLREGESA